MRAMLLTVAVALAAPAYARADDGAAFRNDARRFASLHSFRLQLDSNVPGSGRSRETLTYVEPESLRVDVPAEHFSAVIIGSYLWLRGRSGRWKRTQSAAAAGALAAVRASSRVAEQSRGAFVRYEGPGTLDGRPVRIYELDDLPQDGAPPRIRRIWIGARDGYPYRIDERRGDFSSTATYSSFNRVFGVSQ